MKHTSKILTLLLLVCMLGTLVLTACGGGGGGAGTTAGSTTNGSQSLSAYMSSVQSSMDAATAGSTPGGSSSSSSSSSSSDGGNQPPASSSSSGSAVIQGSSVNYEVEDPLEGKVTEGQYNGKTFFIFTWNYEQWNMETVTTGDVIDTALYEHAKYVQDRLGIELAFMKQEDGWEIRTQFRDAVKTQIANGQCPDLVCSYAPTAVELMLANLNTDLLTINNLDGLSNRWWSQDLIKNAKNNGKLYYMTGEASTSLLYQIQCMVMNLDCIDLNGVMEGTGYADPYEMVADGAWTWDALINMTKDLWKDTAADGSVGSGDTFGFSISSYIDYDQFPLSIGYKSVTVSKDMSKQYTVFETQYETSTMTTFVATIKDLVANNKGIEHSYSAYNGAQNAEFLNGNTCFATGSMAFLRNQVRNQDFTYGVLPYPMLDASQGQHYAALSMYYSMFSIPAQAADKELSGAALQIMGYNGFAKVSKVVFEECFKARYDLTGNDYMIYDILRSSLIFDPGRLLSVKGAFACFRDCMNKGTDWAEILPTEKQTAQNYLTDMLGSSAA